MPKLRESPSTLNHGGIFDIQADVLVVAIGRPNIVTADMVREGAF